MFDNISSESYKYTQEEIDQYQQKIWLEDIVKKYNSKTACTANGLISMETAKDILQRGIKLTKHNSIFNFNTSKKEDSYIMDYLHGNSVIFGHSKAVVSNDLSEDICPFCSNNGDTAHHQLYECEGTKDHTYKQLITALQNDKLDYMTINSGRIIVPKSKNLQHAFITRIQSLMNQHELHEHEDKPNTIRNNSNTNIANI